ncbi:hypothetical protein [Vibrio mediterranei]|nr:hypothetical protein [Vibrio mediterranei]
MKFVMLGMVYVIGYSVTLVISITQSAAMLVVKRVKESYYGQRRVLP